MNISKYSECCICKDCSLCWENRQERVISTTDICASVLYGVHTYQTHINISDFRQLKSALYIIIKYNNQFSVVEKCFQALEEEFWLNRKFPATHSPHVLV